MEEDAEERDGGVDVWTCGRLGATWRPILRPVLVLGWAAFSEPTVLYPDILNGLSSRLNGLSSRRETHRMVYPLGGIVLLKTKFRLLNF